MSSIIVVVVDTGTEHGKTVQKLFGSEKLPRVVVIDKSQKLQIYRSSEPLDGQQWTQILAVPQDEFTK